MNMKKILSAMLGLLMALSVMTSANAATVEFTDVPENHPYKDAIEYCAAKGYMLGVGDNLFAPDALLTRGQLATAWCRALHIIDENHTFDDIAPLSSYYDTPVIVLRSLGILQGSSEKHFSVYTYFTREQLAVIAKRTYGLGVDNEEAYQRYTDHADVSDWAKDGINACLNANIFQGLFMEDKFEPQEPVTRAELCKLIFNIDLPKYDVTIGPLVGGTITASPTSARAGSTISLDVKPDTGMRLVAGSLKYGEETVTGTTFTMPAHDVVVTAEFEEIPILESISIATEATKQTFDYGDVLDIAGLTITANYTNAESKTLDAGFTTDPNAGSALTNEGDVTVTISYTEGGITKTTEFMITVNSAT